MISSAGSNRCFAIHSDCRFKHATLCCLPPGLAQAAQPAVSPVFRAPKCMKNHRVRDPTDHGSVSFVWNSYLHVSFSSGCPKRAFRSLDEPCIPHFLMALCSDWSCCVYSTKSRFNYPIGFSRPSKPTVWSEPRVKFALFDVVVSPLRLTPAEVDSCNPCDVDVCPALGKLSGKLARCLPSRVRGSVTRLKFFGSIVAQPLESQASEVLDVLLGVHCNCADAGAVPLPGTLELRYPAGSCFRGSPTWSAPWSISGVGW